MNRLQRIRSIGHKLLEGPRAILPPDAGYDWLEKDLAIYLHYFRETQIQHISLWSDSTMNKENDFLKPVIRFAHWERKNDLEKNKDANWPDVRVFLGYINAGRFDRLNKAIIAIQESIPSLVFKPLGISLARDVADVERSEPHIDAEIYIRNGVQAITYYSPLLDNDDFSKKVIELKNLMMQSMEQFDHTGWKEKYDSPFDIQTFDWDYKEINGR